MSMPEFPNSPALTREEAINQIISSIAMEELALSHIINAEGEKLQYVLGTIPGSTGPQPTIEQVLEVNESIRGVLSSAAETQSMLRSKLQTALSASVLRGPTGPQGEPGVVEISGFEAEQVDGNVLVEAGQPIIFNVPDADTDDISYDSATGEFTINRTGENALYHITWWIYIEGTGAVPTNISLTIGGAAVRTMSVPFPEMQVTDSAIIRTTDAPMTFSIRNASGDSFSMPATGSQAGITILGFKSQT